jgi:DNA-binding CsgD family transcriptional regulator
VFAGELPGYSLEKRYVSRHGDLAWGSLSVSAALDGAGTPAYTIRMVEDITERKRSEAELARASVEAGRTLARLTKRERQLLELIAAEGFTARQAAESLHISARTAESHLASIYSKFRVKSKDAALAEYRRLVAATSAANASSGLDDHA